MARLKRFIRYIPIFAAVVGILVLTTQNKEETTSLSQSFRNWLVEVSIRLGIDTDTEWWNDRQNVRLLGHVIEYFILGLASGIAFKRKWVALIFCVLISLLDQITKIFVPVRHFDIGDIPFDLVGIVSGILIAWVIGMAIRALGHDGEKPV